MERYLIHFSEFLYVGLCKKIGFPSQVSIRRDVLDMEEKVRFITDTESRYMVSGSRREGFKLPTSDFDYMIWEINQKVICDIRQSQYHRSPRATLILMECCEDRPGFALLQLITPTNIISVVSSCFSWNNRIYISSSKYKLGTIHIFPTSYIHGPCATVRSGEHERDCAFCFTCSTWPPPARSSIERCQRKSWPSPAVLHDILCNGCHLVPIGSRNSPLQDHEWRISFSQAEQKLVYAMNHVQFLCYGLLKLFLKEVISVNVENTPLCSYFMKTVVFWEIQEKVNQTWTPDHILIHFWQCFKHIINWVQRGYCPNFFIPRNNMFFGKVEGSVQTTLLAKLHDLYNTGVSCLLHCKSLRSQLYYAICNRTLSISTNKIYFIQEAVIDGEVFSNVQTFVRYNFRTSLKLRLIQTIETFAQSRLSRYKVIVLQKYFSIGLQQIVFCFQNTYCTSTNNKQSYGIDRLLCRLLKLAARFGDISDLLYIAMYYYNTNRDRKALACTELAKQKLCRQYLVYNVMDRNMYSEAVGGMSLSKKMREAIAFQVVLKNNVCYIDELKLEQKISKSNHHPALFISPFVMVNMLKVLCHRGDPHIQQEALHDLQTLLTIDQDQKYTTVHDRDISWQILGLCYQINGDVYNALQAYQHSLNQNPYNKIQEASITRIKCLVEAHGNYLYNTPV